MFGYSIFFQSLLDCVQQIINYKTKKIEKQESIDILTDKKDLKKAGNIAEQIIEITLNYKFLMSKKDQRKIESLVKKFNKVD